MDLKGKRIAVAETRELEVLCGLLERRGADVVRCPLVNIHDAPEPAKVLDFARHLAGGGFDDFILLTGEGLRRILACIDRLEPDLRAHFIQGLTTLRTITRGPKPARALREIGLKPDLEAAAPTTDGVIRTLADHGLKGRRIAVQLYGNLPNIALTRFLKLAGAETSTVAPYVYGNAADDATVTAVLERMAAGEVDAIAFTSKQQIERLVAQFPKELVHRALGRTAIAAVGPVVAEAIRMHGFEVSTSPGQQWFMKPLVVALTEHLAHSRE